MSKSGRELTRLPDQTPYDVGYRKPPVRTRFQPGSSGNPKGRPRGRKLRHDVPEERLKAIILDEAYRTIKVNDGDRQVTVPMAQAIMRSLAVTAAKGNTRAQRLFAELLATTENANQRRNEDWIETAITYKLDWDQELARRKRFGIIAPDPLPHPDDIIINFRGAGPVVDIRGPMSKEELAEIHWILDRKSEFEQELADLAADCTDPKNADLLQVIEKDIAHVRRLLSLAERALARKASPASLGRITSSRGKTSGPATDNIPIR